MRRSSLIAVGLLSVLTSCSKSKPVPDGTYPSPDGRSIVRTYLDSPGMTAQPYLWLTVSGNSATESPRDQLRMLIGRCDGARLVWLSGGRIGVQYTSVDLDYYRATGESRSGPEVLLLQRGELPLPPGAKAGPSLNCSFSR